MFAEVVRSGYVGRWPTGYHVNLAEDHSNIVKPCQALSSSENPLEKDLDDFHGSS